MVTMFLCLRYGLKGAVYLKNRENQVVCVESDGRCVWQAGTMDRQLDRISTTTSTGTHTFRVFDHITVSMAHTHTHANNPINVVFKKTLAFTVF